MHARQLPPSAPRGASRRQTRARGAGNLLDGDPDTFWHSQYKPGISPLPHTIDIVMGGQTNQVNGLQYVPRQDGSRNGHCGRYEIRLSKDGARARRPRVCAVRERAGTGAARA